VREPGAGRGWTTQRWQSRRGKTKEVCRSNKITLFLAPLERGLPREGAPPRAGYTRVEHTVVADEKLMGNRGQAVLKRKTAVTGGTLGRNTNTKGRAAEGTVASAPWLRTARWGTAYTPKDRKLVTVLRVPQGPEARVRRVRAPSVPAGEIGALRSSSRSGASAGTPKVLREGRIRQVREQAHARAEGTEGRGEGCSLG
jgi:hypothetical protein